MKPRSCSLDEHDHRDHRSRCSVTWFNRVDRLSTSKPAYLLADNQSPWCGLLVSRYGRDANLDRLFAIASPNLLGNYPMSICCYAIATWSKVYRFIKMILAGRVATKVMQNIAACAGRNRTKMVWCVVYVICLLYSNAVHARWIGLALMSNVAFGCSFTSVSNCTVPVERRFQSRWCTSLMTGRIVEEGTKYCDGHVPSLIAGNEWRWRRHGRLPRHSPDAKCVRVTGFNIWCWNGKLLVGV